jgi:hypothetical protein
MNYAVEMGSGAMIYIPSLIRIGSGIRKLIEGDSQTYRQHIDRIRLLSFIKIGKVGYKIVKWKFWNFKKYSSLMFSVAVYFLV